MFTGIIETIGEVQSVYTEGTTIRFRIKSDITTQLKVDQSVAHDGVCLTVVHVDTPFYEVVAVEETLNKTQLGTWKSGTKINLERAAFSGARLDGHIVQGHVDMVGKCVKISENEGSRIYEFQFPAHQDYIVVNKGSITVNGVSLTVVDPTNSSFKVAIIPYTFQQTTFQYLKTNDSVNLEFDIIGKYIGAYMKAYRSYYE